MTEDSRAKKAKKRKPPADIGLCARCAHLCQQATARGAVFYRCARADEDTRFPRYPPIPVLRCLGYEARERD